jgi:hypothetical protein
MNIAGCRTFLANSLPRRLILSCQRSAIGLQPPAYCFLPTAYCSMDYADPLYRSAAFQVSQRALA